MKEKASSASQGRDVARFARVIRSGSGWSQTHKSPAPEMVFTIGVGCRHASIPVKELVGRGDGPKAIAVNRIARQGDDLPIIPSSYSPSRADLLGPRSESSRGWVGPRLHFGGGHE